MLAQLGASRAGTVRLLWARAEILGFRTTIDRIGGRRSSSETPAAGNPLHGLGDQPCPRPEGAAWLGPWVAPTDLPHLAGFPDEAFGKDGVLNALDSVCHDDPAIAQGIHHTREFDIALSARWRKLYPLPPGEKEAVAFDLTSVLFIGVTCPIDEVGRNPDY